MEDTFRFVLDIDDAPGGVTWSVWEETTDVRFAGGLPSAQDAETIRGELATGNPSSPATCLALLTGLRGLIKQAAAESNDKK